MCTSCIRFRENIPVSVSAQYLAPHRFDPNGLRLCVAFTRLLSGLPPCVRYCLALLSSLSPLALFRWSLGLLMPHCRSYVTTGVVVSSAQRRRMGKDSWYSRKQLQHLAMSGNQNYTTQLSPLVLQAPLSLPVQRSQWADFDAECEVDAPRVSFS